MSESGVGPVGRGSAWKRADYPFLTPLGSPVLALSGACAISLRAWAPDEMAMVTMIGLFGLIHAVMLWTANELPLGYRLASAGALLCMFAAAVAPGLLGVAPTSAGAAVALAAGGSAPMWAVALKWGLAERRRATSR